MRKKFYFVVFCALCLSACLLGFSYAKESGTNQETFLNQEKVDDLRVVYSSSYLSTFDKEGTDISVINHGEKETDVILALVGKDGEEITDDIYYMINDGELKKWTRKEIKIGSLKSYGMDGDQVTFNVKVSGKSEEPVYLEAKIKKEERKTFLDMLGEVDNIYTDDKGHLRYYGSFVSNYINVEGVRYRIVGEFDGKFRLVTEIMDESNYEVALSTGTLLSYEDYLSSFRVGMVDELIVRSSSSWLKEQQFWLADSKDGRGYVASAKLGIYTDDNSKPHNNRYVKEIDSTCYYVAGDGTESNPYEVTYGS